MALILKRAIVAATTLGIDIADFGTPLPQAVTLKPRSRPVSARNSQKCDPTERAPVETDLFSSHSLVDH